MLKPIGQARNKQGRDEGEMRERSKLSLPLCSPSV